MSRTIFMSVPDDTACSLYRNYLPFLHCYHDLSLNDIWMVADKKPQDKEDFDVFCFNRVINNVFYKEYLSPLLKSGKKIVWQTDDDLWNIPLWNPSRDLLQEGDLDNTALVRDECDAIIVSTQELANTMPNPEKVFVLPNLIDLSFFGGRKDHSDFTKIIWAGSSSHDLDLEQITSPIARIATQYPEVAIIFWGYLPTNLSTFIRKPGHPYAYLIPNYPNVYYGEWFPGRLYFKKLNALAPDIAIIPLSDCKFNESKSNLKYLEMSMAGAACIATRSTPYQCIKHNETGILIDDPAEWYDAIKTLLDDVSFRKKLVKNAQEQIREEYSWQCSKKDLWVKGFIEIANLK